MLAAPQREVLTEVTTGTWGILKLGTEQRATNHTPVHKTAPALPSSAAGSCFSWIALNPTVISLIASNDYFLLSKVVLQQRWALFGKQDQTRRSHLISLLLAQLFLGLAQLY